MAVNQELQAGHLGKAQEGVFLHAVDGEKVNEHAGMVCPADMGFRTGPGVVDPAAFAGAFRIHEDIVDHIIRVLVFPHGPVVIRPGQHQVDIVVPGNEAFMTHGAEERAAGEVKLYAAAFAEGGKINQHIQLDLFHVLRG